MPRPKRVYDIRKSAEQGQPGAVLLEMIGLADSRRCMACGWPLESSEKRGCVIGNCSFRPQEHDEAYPRWHERTQILVLARKPFQVK